MSWNGTVTCGYCYAQGHNKRGCPKRHTDAASTPGSWLAESVAREKVASKKRRCSYCAKIGHTRRTCTELRGRVRSAKIANRKYRRDFANYINDLGLCPGALVVRRDVEEWQPSSRTYTTYETQVSQLLEIMWDHVDYRALEDKYKNPSVFVFAPVSKLMDGGSRFTAGYSEHPTAKLPKVLKDLDGETHHYMANWELVSPCTGSSYSAPKGYEEESGYIDEDFKTEQSPDYYENKRIG